MNKFTKILTTLSTGPEGQLENSVRQRLRALAEQDNLKSDELLAILDDCVFFSLCTDICVSFMHAIWLLMLEDEKTTPVEALRRRDNSLASISSGTHKQIL